MDTYHRIQKSIEYIETKLFEELKIQNVAAQSYFSPFHFQRMFQAISGFTVQEYIRNRRLSEAAVLLKKDIPIIQIALDCQYGSQESFTRSFSAFSGITPSKYRKSQAALKLQPKINFLAFQHNLKGEIHMNKPQIVNLPPIQIIGCEYKTNLNNDAYFEDIPGFYHDFGMNEYFMKIPGKLAPGMSYGIACTFEDDGGFTFVIGEESKACDAKLDAPLIQMKIPEGKYAEFKVNGSADLVQNNRKYIYGTWLPQSNFERREGPDFEVTDVLGSSYPEKMKMKIYIPVY
ncbi:effector binding domain-containing protein [Metabacillus idriensis]|uniref:Helix-turn-helix domain-containing protein n=1 Tax=Metabacillus idriensis TaxID=324768 RepID=A0A6I2M410_9BACI|nr:effector binding domain-containing protein [Metabacillus idriensis]MCM3595152.1 effector binding domain-containing protein [Metabacillus idriensis]MRX52820.1 helix-turn-helix domain-containing protein [Metabacillus idriensis]